MKGSLGFKGKRGSSNNKQKVFSFPLFPVRRGHKQCDVHQWQHPGPHFTPGEAWWTNEQAATLVIAHTGVFRAALVCLAPFASCDAGNLDGRRRVV